LRQHEGYFGTDLATLTHVQITRTMAGNRTPHFIATPAGGHLAPTELTCTRPVYNAVLHGIGSRTWNPPSSNPRPYHQATAVSHTARETCQLVQSTKEK
ncbi:hypothetical protein AVEN_217479-1, partial [Araneus ventricosus]